MYDLKHELISVQIKLENADKALDKLKEENKELQMKIVQLETEIKNNKENQNMRGAVGLTALFKDKDTGMTEKSQKMTEN